MVVIASIVGLGWLLNEIYISVEAQPRDNSGTETYLAISREIIAALATAPDQALFVESWNKNSAIRLALIPREDIPLPHELEQLIDRGEGLILESDEGVAAHFMLPGNVDIVSVSLPFSLQSTDESKIKLVLTLSFYAGITTIILLWLWPLIHRLMGLRDTAKKFGRGDLSARVSDYRLSYIRDIEREFNRMADRIQSLISDNKLLSRAVSHDLKTPIARLRFGLDALTEADNTEQREKYALRVNRDMEEMESLVETLLQYARLDENRVQMTQANVDVQVLSQRLIQTHETPNLSLRFECRTDLKTVSADKRYLAMLINNLLSNAVRHAKQQVLVVLHEDNGQLVLSVEDDGVGIPNEERANAVKPFWRGTPGRGTKGHGMGLAIVSRIAEWHGASVSINASDALGGAAIQLRFKAV